MVVFVVVCVREMCTSPDGCVCGCVLEREICTAPDGCAFGCETDVYGAC
jgi:hypothetical protein